MIKKITKNNQDGQVILFVVIAMVIALSLGIAVSARTLSSITRVTDTDTSSRALAAAEGGAERMLQRPYNELEGFMSGTCNNEASATTYNLEPCVVKFEYAGVDTKAVVFVTTLNDAFYRVGSFDAGQVKQLIVQGYSGKIRFCWSSTASPAANIAYSIVGTDFSVTKGFIQSLNGVQPNKNGSFNLTQATPPLGQVPYSNYMQCGDISIPANADLLRIRPVNGSVEKALFAGLSSNLPNQGFTIQSIGMLESDGKLIKRSVRVTKSYPYAAYSLFDYALYSNSGDITN